MADAESDGRLPFWLSLAALVVTTFLPVIPAKGTWLPVLVFYVVAVHDEHRHLEPLEGLA